MAEYVRKEDRPIVDAIQIKWRTPLAGREGVRVKDGDWVIRHSDGSTTYCGDEYFQATYVKA